MASSFANHSMKSTIGASRGVSNSSPKLSMRSLYRALTFGGAIDQQMVEIWKSKVPLKVQGFNVFVLMTV